MRRCANNEVSDAMCTSENVEMGNDKEKSAQQSTKS
jgi:hypothetical protein